MCVLGWHRPAVCSRRAHLVGTAGGQEWLSLLEAGLLSPGSFLRARQSPACLRSFVPSCARATAFSPSWQRGAERLPSHLTALSNFSTLSLLLQEDLEKERSQLLTRAIVAEEQVSELQEYVEKHLAR